MKRRVPSIIFATFAIGLLSALPHAQAPAAPAATPAQVAFARDIQPIFEKACASCHSADLKLAELDLSTREAAMKGGDHGAVIVPGSAEKSKLYRVVAGLDQPAMPMEGDALKPAEVAAIKAWIDQGANWETSISFAKDIQPIMERSCWNCHGAAMQLSKLDLRTREGALRGGAHGPALTPGNADQSRMYRAVAHLDAIKMPMQGEKLKPEEIAAFKTWIDQGAQWDAAATTAAAAKPATSAVAALENMELTPEQRNYWAFKLPVQKTPPVASKADFSHPIDRFLEATRAEKKLVAAPRADKRTLIRRAYIDLIGLPPSPADVEAFVADQSEGAWDKLITKLLASPQYGERMGRHWLDVARYADSNGFEQDYDRPNAWRYRDYVISAFNEDKPYNQFLKEQIAGDELDYVTHETLIATGFLRAGPRVLFREKDNPERRWDYVDDLIATLGRGVMGMTVNCARCHNHKFDPIAQKDYYALAAAVNGWVETDWPLVGSRAEAETYLKKNREIDDKIEALRDKISAIEKPYRDELRAAYIKKEYPENVQRAVFKPEAERTPGEQLLATQVLTGGGGGTPEQIEKMMKPEERAQKKELTSQIAGIEKQRPKAPPMAEIITDGDWRFAPMGRGDETIGCPKCRLPPPDRPNGTYLHEGPGKYEPPPTNFLIRGDPESRGSLMKPGFLTVALHGEHPTEIPRPDGRTSGRRLALAEWLGFERQPADRARHRQPCVASPLRSRHRGDARQLRQDGRAADASGAARLSGCRVHEAGLEHQAAPSLHDDVRGLPDGVGVRSRRQREGRPGKPVAVAVSSAAARRRDDSRCDALGRRQHQPDDGRAGVLPERAEGDSGDRTDQGAVGQPARWSGHLAPQHLHLPAALAAVSDVRNVRSSGHEPHGRGPQRVDGADAGVDAAQ